MYVTGNCKEQELTCNNGRCIDIRLKCNGRDECGDRSDEIDCGKCLFLTSLWMILCFGFYVDYFMNFGGASALLSLSRHST